MTFVRMVIPLYLFDLNMIFAQTRFRACREGKPVPDFPDHALGQLEYRPCEAGPQADRVPILTIDYR